MAFPMGTAVLHDATIKEDVRQCLLGLIERNATLALKSAPNGALQPEGLHSVPTGSEATAESASAGKRDGSASKHHLQPRESPSAGGAGPLHGQIDAHASNAFQVRKVRGFLRRASGPPNNRTRRSFTEID